MQALIGVLAVVILAQVATGITFGGHEGEIGLRRSQQPGQFWGRVLAQVALLVVLVAVLDQALVHRTVARVRSLVEGMQERAQEAKASQASPTTEAARDTTPRVFVSSAQKKIAVAYQMAKRGDNGPASQIFGEVIAEADTSAYVRYSRAMAFFKMNKWDSALIDFRRVAELQPGNYDARVGIDRILAPRGQWDEILASWTAYLKVQPKDGKAYYERGGTHYRKGDRAAALKDADKACELGIGEACTRAASLRP